MRALVTGGAGFIGSTLVDRLLAEGHQVDVLDDLSTGNLANLAEARRTGARRLSFHQVDVRAPELVELVVRRRPEVLFHLAAQASNGRGLADPAQDAEVNIVGSLRVLEGARQAGTKKIVYASGGDLYGRLDPTDLPVAESTLAHPITPTAASKRAVQDYLSLYRDLYGIEFTALALANVYGPRQREDAEGGVVGVFARQLLADEPCTIDGDGNQTRDFVYVDDVVDAFARAAARGSGLLINIGRGIEVTINELFATMAAASGRRGRPRRGPVRVGEIGRSALDATRARIHLDWRPWTSLEEGIDRVVAAARATSGSRS